MNWLKVNEFVEAWAAERALLANLKGRALTLVEFESEAGAVAATTAFGLRGLVRAFGRRLVAASRTRVRN